MFPKVAQKVTTAVLHKSEVFYNCPKSLQLIGLLLLEILSTRTLKIAQSGQTDDLQYLVQFK